jgi:hypothetical protein
MDHFTIRKSDKQSVLITLSPLWGAFDFILFLSCLLLLDFEIKTRLGSETLFYSKFSFFVRLALDILRKGTWVENAFCIVPAGLMAACLLSTGFHFRYFFDGSKNQAFLAKTFFLIPLEKREIPFEAAKEICLLKRKNRKGIYSLMIEEGSGEKIKLLESSRRESLWSLAKKIQEITNLPVTQKLHP